MLLSCRIKSANTKFTNYTFKMLTYGERFFHIHTKIHIMESTINSQCLKQSKTLVSHSFFFKQLLYMWNASEFKLHNTVDTIIPFKAIHSAWMSLTEILQVKQNLFLIWLLYGTVLQKLLVYFCLVQLHGMLIASQTASLQKLDFDS